METDRTRPSLVGARLRVSRAAEHANEIIQLLDVTTRASGTVWIRVDAVEYARKKGVEVDVDWSEWEHPPSSQLSLLASECLFNVRAALDYVVYELAWLDLGSPKEQTQFPIVDEVSAWPDVSKRRLPGLTPEHQDQIREYQPFSGCEWTRVLRDLSNADKHRLLVSVSPMLTYQFHLPSLAWEPDPKDPSKLRAPVQKPAASVSFPDYEPAVDTLKTLVGEAARLVERFQLSFGERFRLRLQID